MPEPLDHPDALDPPPPSAPLPTTAPAAPAAPPDYASAQLANVATAVREMAHPAQVGPYVIHQVIGEGGMGIVYKAEQRHPIRRTVAVKVVKLGMDTREVIARFESERQALALMNHPNVAKVLDAGATETGRPYFVMEHVQGEPITTFADRHHLTIRQRLELFTQACDAVQHAHQKAIIHRDLKPSNILVALVDDKPQVKVIDFGVAKAIAQRLTERTLFTETGQLVGTPEYMAPEQAEGSALHDVDTRSDVYSLGVVLYELLSGSLPFDAKTLRSGGFNEIQRIIREVDPPRPSTRLSKLGGARAEDVAKRRRTELDVLARQLKNELEWIPLKAMHKDRARRYASPAELAEDVGNYLANQPLRAAPDSAAYRVRKFLRRNKGAVAASAAMVFLLLAGIAATTWQAVIATRQRDIAIAAREAEAQSRAIETHTDRLLIDVFGSIDPEHARGRPVLVREVLDQAARRLDERPPAHGGVEGHVRQIFAGTYLALGLPDLAMAQLERARAVDQFSDRGGPTRRAGLLQKLGDTYYALGNAAEAEAALRQSVELFRALDPPRPLDTIAAQSTLAYVLLHEGKVEEADALLADTVERMKRAPADDRGIRVSVINHLGTLRVAQGRYPEAEALFRDTLKDVLADHDPDHPDAITLTNNLADLLRNRGKPDEAAAMYERVLEPASLLWGAADARTLGLLNNYALCLDAVGRRDEAERHYLRLIDAARDSRHADHPLALLAHSNYGLLLMRTGRLDEAERTFVELIPRMTQTNGPDQQDTILAESNLARTRAMKGNLDGAADIYRELLPRAKRALGETGPAAVSLSMFYGDVLARQQKWPEAEPLLADAYAGAKAQGIEPRIATSAAAYGVCLAKLKKFDQADAPLRDAYARLKDAPQAQRAPLRDVLSALVETSESRNQGTDAARFRAELSALAPASRPASNRAP